MAIIKRAAKQMALEDEASGLLRDDMTPQAAVGALLEAGQVVPALKLLARLLPKRYVVAWLCQCAHDQALPVEDRAGAALAEQWVRDPSEENRRAAFEFANRGNYESLGAWIAASAGWAAGSLAPAGQEVPVPPEEHLTARAAVAAANLLAALEPEQFDTRRMAYIQRGLELFTHKRTASPS